MASLSKRELYAIDNMAIIMKAKKDGLAVYPSDVRINYAEIDDTLQDLEEQWINTATKEMQQLLLDWAAKIKKKKDLTKDPGLQQPLQDLFLSFIRSVWAYGQQTAEDELTDVETAALAEGSLSDKTNDDAFEWYQLYTKELSKQTEKAVFHYMQPTILDHLDQGTVGTALAGALEEDFGRFGQVRTKIIARTESNKAFNWGRRYRFDKSSAIAGYRYSAILDERTTEICQTLHGHSWEIDDPALDVHTPPNHFQCRSVIVPISKFVSWEFDPPPAGWESALPDKEKKVFDKFKASEFYPKAATVDKKAVPKMAAPKQQKKPAAPAAPAPAASAGGSVVIGQLVAMAQEQAASYLDVLAAANAEAGVQSTDPGMIAAAALIADIRSGAYEQQLLLLLEQAEILYPGLSSFLEDVSKFMDPFKIPVPFEDIDI